MAINNLITILFIFIEALLISTSTSSAKKFIVGDDNGWSLNFDYQSWAKSKEFVVGDQIVFKYPIGKHNVIKVDETGFQRCLVLSANELLATGYDVVALTTPGRKWYISGIGKHCETDGMKLVIDVLPQSTQAPVVTPVPSFAPLGKTKYLVGDDKGWTLNIDYKAWAAGKKFVVGDSLGVLTQISIDKKSRKYFKMVTSHLIVVFITTLSVLASLISAKEYIVGDERGWTLDFDYQTWAKDKVFFVGDTLVFNYASGAHTVVKVNGTGFQQCIVSPSIGTLTSGQDMIPLQTPGRKWYICGVGKHCESRNMKLVITVLPQTMAPAPSPMATSASSNLAAPTFYGFVVALFGSLLLLFI